MDPRSSVLGYIAENIPQERLGHQGNATAGNLQANPPNNQQYVGQSQSDHSQGSFVRPHSPSQVIGGVSQMSSPLTTYIQSAQNTHGPLSQPYVASKLSQISNGYGNAAHAMETRPETPQQTLGQGPLSQQANTSSGKQNPSQQLPQTSAQYLSNQGSGQSSGTIAHGLPPVGARRTTLPHSAPRFYHRMVHDFKSTKNTYYIAKRRKYCLSKHTRPIVTCITESDTQGMTSSAYELEALSRRIWSLRVEHAWEFEGYSESSHQAIISGWQAQYELWADTVLDIQEGQNSPRLAGPVLHNDVPAPASTETWNPQGRQDRPGYQDMNEEHMQSARPLHNDAMSHLQSLSLGQTMLPEQHVHNYQSSQPDFAVAAAPDAPQAQASNPGRPMIPFQQQSQSPQPPGAFPQNGPPLQTNAEGQSVAFQQQPQNSQPPQTTMGQDRPPVMGLGIHGGQATGPRPVPTIHQGQNMQPIPSSIPQQQQNQNMQPSSSPNAQQNQPPVPYIQQTPNGPPGMASNMQQGPNTQQAQNMNQGPSRQNMSPGQNPSPRPNLKPQMPPSLQAGDQTQQNGR